MSNQDEFIDIVNENDQVIGQAERKEAHEKGLLHRTAATWFYNDRGEILLQKRSEKKDIMPGTLGISASGHVEAGKDVPETLTREILEETGLTVHQGDCTFLEKKIFDAFGVNHFANFFAYRFLGSAEDLKFDTEEVSGFQWVDASHLLDPTDEEQKIFHPFIISPLHRTIVEKLIKLADAK